MIETGRRKKKRKGQIERIGNEKKGEGFFFCRSEVRGAASVERILVPRDRIASRSSRRDCRSRVCRARGPGRGGGSGGTLGFHRFDKSLQRGEPLLLDDARVRLWTEDARRAHDGRRVAVTGPGRDEARRGRVADRLRRESRRRDAADPGRHGTSSRHRRRRRARERSCSSREREVEVGFPEVSRRARRDRGSERCRRRHRHGRSPTSSSCATLSRRSGHEPRVLLRWRHLGRVSRAFERRR